VILRESELEVEWTWKGVSEMKPVVPKRILTSNRLKGN